MVIHKYTIANTEFQHVMIPMDATIISVHEQRGQLSLWAMHGAAKGIEMRHIRILHTGQQFAREHELLHIGTLLLAGGDYVLHVFEELRS